MEKMSVLMSVEAHKAWAETHPLGSEVNVTIAGTEFSAVVSDYSAYKGKIEVRFLLRSK